MKRGTLAAGLGLGILLLSTGGAFADRICPAPGYVELRWEKPVISDWQSTARAGKPGKDEFGDKIRQPHSAEGVAERFSTAGELWARVSAKSFKSATWRSDTGEIRCIYQTDQDGVIHGFNEIMIKPKRPSCYVTSTGNWVSETQKNFSYDSNGKKVYSQNYTILRCSDDRKKCVWSCEE